MIITISSMKGGVGKTETSLNLAMAIKKTGRSVVLIDFDIPYGGVAQALGETKEISVTDWIMTNRDINVKALRSLVSVHAESGLNYIPAIARVSDIERLDDKVINRIISNLSSIYDYIVIDSGVDMSLPTKEALKMSDRIVIVTTPGRVSAQNNYRHKEELVKLGVNQDKLLLFVNMIRNNKEAEEMAEKIVDAFNSSGVSIETVAAVCWDDAVANAREDQEFIFTINPRNGFSKGINQILRKLGIADPDFSRKEQSIKDRVSFTEKGKGFFNYFKELMSWSR